MLWTVVSVTLTLTLLKLVKAFPGLIAAKILTLFVPHRRRLVKLSALAKTRAMD